MQKIEVEKIVTLTGHRDCVYALEEGLQPGTFYSAAGDGQVVQWSLDGDDRGELLASVEKSVYALCTLPERGLLLVGHNFNGLHIIDLHERKLLKTVPLPPVAIFDLKRLNGKIYAALGDGSLVVLDETEFTIETVLKASAKSLRALAFNPHTNELAAGYSDYHIRIFDLPTLSVKKVLQAHTNSVFALAYSPDGQHLLSGGRDAHLRIWNLAENYAEEQAIVAHMYTIHSIAYSPDGRYFATASMDKTLKVWDAQRFQLLKVIDKARHAGHGTSVNKLFWSGHRNRLVSCSDDRTISVWEVNFGLRYENHSVRDQAENI